jgi:hypothetical protein
MSSMRLPDLLLQAFRLHGHQIGPTATIANPGGFLLGPLLRNVLYDDVVEIPLSGGFEVLSYADDTTPLVEAENLTKLKEAIESLSRWNERKRLKFEPTKADRIYLKGGGSIQIPFITDKVCFLGLNLGASSTFAFAGREDGLLIPALMEP